LAIKPWQPLEDKMSNSASQYETRAAIETQVELARRARSADKPGLTAFWPIGLYVGLATAVMAGVAISAISNARRPTDPATTAGLQREAKRAALRAEPLGGSAGISRASPTIDREEAQHRLCVTAESCVDVAPAPVRSNLDATAGLPAGP
jgi:hypothetical protein